MTDGLAGTHTRKRVPCRFREGARSAPRANPESESVTLCDEIGGGGMARTPCEQEALRTGHPADLVKPRWLR
jgi:hypothetical protein